MYLGSDEHALYLLGVSICMGIIIVYITGDFDE